MVVVYTDLLANMSIHIHRQYCCLMVEASHICRPTYPVPHYERLVMQLGCVGLESGGDRASPTRNMVIGRGLVRC